VVSCQERHENTKESVSTQPPQQCPSQDSTSGIVPRYLTTVISSKFKRLWCRRNRRSTPLRRRRCLLGRTRVHAWWPTKTLILIVEITFISLAALSWTSVSYCKHTNQYLCLHCAARGRSILPMPPPVQICISSVEGVEEEDKGFGNFTYIGPREVEHLGSVSVSVLELRSRGWWLRMNSGNID